MKKSNSMTVSNSHKLWLEVLNQKATPTKIKSQRNQSASTLPNSARPRTQYKSQEEYHDEVIMLKKSVVQLKGENELLKSKCRQSEEELEKKDKTLTEFIETIENNKSIKNPSVNNYVTIMKLKQNIAQLKSSLKTKESEILDLKSDLKYTKSNESKVETDVYLQEIRSLQQIVKNLNAAQQKSVLQEFEGKEDHMKMEVVANSRRRPQSHNKNSAVLTEKNKLLAEENKNLKLQIEQINSEKLNRLEVKSDRKEELDKLMLEVERLKKQNKEINQEKTDASVKYEEIKSKYLNQEDKHNAKLKEVERKLELSKKQSRDISSRSPTPTTLLFTELDNKSSKQESSHQKPTSNDIIQSAVQSYVERKKILQASAKTEETVITNRDDEIIKSMMIGHTDRQRILVTNSKMMKEKTGGNER